MDDVILSVSGASLRELQDQIRQVVGEGFAEASDHPYHCTCDSCREWWRRMGADPDTGLFGPFGETLGEG
jgi:hypothetical protein